MTEKQYNTRFVVIIYYNHFIARLVRLSHEKFAAYDFALICLTTGTSTSYDHPIRNHRRFSVCNISSAVLRQLTLPFNKVYGFVLGIERKRHVDVRKWVGAVIQKVLIVDLLRFF